MLRRRRQSPRSAHPIAGGLTLGARTGRGAWPARFGACAAWLVASCLAGCSTPTGSKATPAVEQAPPAGIRIVGAPTDIREDLEETIAEFNRGYEESGKRSFVDDAAYEAELFLRQRGYASAEVTYEVAGEAASIQVSAGVRLMIGNVTVTLLGESPITRSDLALYVNGPRTGFLGRGSMLYIESRVKGAPRSIEENLQALGCLDAKVTMQVADFPEAGGGVDVALAVSPGPRYTVSEVTFSLDRTSPSLSNEVNLHVREVIDKALKEGKGPGDGDEPTYRPRLLGTLRGAVSEALGHSGYPDALVKIKPSVDPDTKRATLRMTLQPGPYVVLNEVEIVGAERTSASYLASRMRIEKGDVYDATKLRHSLRGLYRTGLFSQVTTQLKGDGEARSVVLEVVERPSIEFFAEPSFGSYELFGMTLGARDRNLFGRGIVADAEATVAVRVARLQLGLSDPWFLEQDLIGDLRVELDQRQEPSFLRETRGVGAFVTKDWTSRQSSTLGYRFGRSAARDVEAIDDDVLEVQSAVNVAGLIATQRYDGRNALFAPSAGIFAEASVEMDVEGLGSELEFLRGKLTAAWFTPLGERSVLGAGLRGGVIAPAFDETIIPIQERFFAGGENSVRSFQESRLGPLDADGEPLGGEAFATLSLEWRQEIVGAFQSAVFIDAGFVEAQAEDLFSFDDVRMGVGFGVRYLLPIGPLRIDAGFNPDSRAGEDEWVIHFAIGMPF